ncbi:MAG: MFS transporter [Dehalococcoidales bacterium]|jgi:MFS family permease|nr:MFS transporter [Dehalococcoidales bacterium]
MKIRIFYGWYIVFASLLLTMYYSAIFTYGWTSFVTPILATFGWSMTQLSLASTLRGLESGVFNPLFGMAVDRWSPRKLMLFGVIVTAAGIFLISRTTSLIIYYLGFLVMGAGSSLVTSMVPTATIARWFRRDVGKANGLFYVGTGIGGVLVFLITTMIDRYGWQTVLFYGSIGFLLIGIPLSFVFRRRPEDCGLVPDGKIERNNRSQQTKSAGDTAISVRQVLRMRVFWYLSIVILFQSAVLGIVTLYAMPYLENIGFSRANASLVVTVFTIISVCARMPVGMLADIFQKKYVIALAIALLGTGLFLFWVITAGSPFWLIVLFAACYGIGISGIMPLRMPFMVEYFGSRKIGTIFGLTSIFSTLAGVTAVPLAGLYFDHYHTYKPIWLFLVCFAVVASLLMLAMPQPAIWKQGVPVKNKSRATS